MSDDVRPEWQQVGETDNARMFRHSETVLIIVPHQDSRDTAETAKQSLDFQRSHWDSLGHAGGVVVLLDPIAEQEGGARRVYSTAPTDIGTTGFALVGGSFLGRAIGSVFLGLAKPPIPTKLFATVDDAIAWLASLDAKAGA